MNVHSSLPAIPEIGLTEIDGEPRARDIEIAERLGMSRPRDIRQLIERNLSEIEGFGPARRRTAMVGIGSGAEREVEEFWLSEEQALLVAALSKAPHAAAVRAMLIRCFVAWRRGHLAPVQPAHSVADFEAEARKIIGGIVKSVVHAQIEPIASEVRALTAIVQPSVPGVVIRHGKTAGAILKSAGFTKCPMNFARWFANRLESAGCRVEGHVDTGVCRARLFDPDKAEAWLKNGGRAAVEMKIAERSGQGALALTGRAHRAVVERSGPPVIPADIYREGVGAIFLDGAPVFFDIRDIKIGPGDRAVVVTAAGDVKVDTPRPDDPTYRPMGARGAMASAQMEAVPGRHDAIPVEWRCMILGKVIERQNVVRLPSATA